MTDSMSVDQAISIVSGALDMHDAQHTEAWQVIHAALSAPAGCVVDVSVRCENCGDVTHLQIEHAPKVSEPPEGCPATPMELVGACSTVAFKAGWDARQSSGSFAEAVEDVLRGAMGLARKINDGGPDDFLNLSADLLRLLQTALSPRRGLLMFRIAAAPAVSEAAPAVVERFNAYVVHKPNEIITQMRAESDGHWIAQAEHARIVAAQAAEIAHRDNIIHGHAADTRNYQRLIRDAERVAEALAGLLAKLRTLLYEAAEPAATQKAADIGMVAQWDVDALAAIVAIDALIGQATPQPHCDHHSYFEPECLECSDALERLRKSQRV